jgi:hypothetical protein
MDGVKDFGLPIVAFMIIWWIVGAYVDIPGFIWYVAVSALAYRGRETTLVTRRFEKVKSV